MLWCLRWQLEERSCDHGIWHENRKEGFALHQDGTCCEMSGLRGEIENQVSDMLRLRNLTGMEVGTWMDKSRVQGEGARWYLKPCCWGNWDKGTKKLKDRILETPSLRACGNKKHLEKEKKTEGAATEGRNQESGVLRKWREVFEGRDRWGQMWLTGQTHERLTTYSVFSNYPKEGRGGLSAAVTWPAAWAKEINQVFSWIIRPRGRKITYHLQLSVVL